MSSAEKNDWVDTETVAQAMGVSPKTVRAWARSGLVPYIRTSPGRAEYRFRLEDVEQALLMVSHKQGR